MLFNLDFAIIHALREKTAQNKNNVGSDFLFAIVGVVLFTVIIVTLAIFIKRYGKQGVFFNSHNEKQNIKIIERLAVAPDKFLIILDVCGEILLLGVSSQNISLIKELDADNVILPPEAKLPQPILKFSEILENIKKKGKDK